MKKTRKNIVKRKCNRRKSNKRTSGGAAPAAGAGYPEHIRNLFETLKIEQKKITEAQRKIEEINRTDDKINKKIKDIKDENKKINDAYYKIEEILNKIKMLNDKETKQRGKKILDMYVMKFFHEPGKKTPTVYFDNYQPNTDENKKFGIDTEDFWVNPMLQFNAIDELLDIKKSRTKYTPEMIYYKVEQQ